MALDIVVIRDDGDLDGGVIQDPLLSALPAALARGAKELNDASDTETVQIEAKHTPQAVIGKLVAVDDTNYGEVWVGRIVVVSHGQAGGAPHTMLTLRRKSWQTL
ncbi:MAG: hypothetical protein LPH21_08775 [Shewanella sp.]|nr:hypothetical protein [Shewanella sp.]